MKRYSRPLPAGAYLFEVTDVTQGELRTDPEQHAVRMKLRLLGTDREEHLYLTEAAAFKWQDWIDSFDEVFSTVGRIFLITTRVMTKHPSRQRLTVLSEILCEMLPSESRS